MLRQFRAARDERGVSAIEYGVIAALIAVVIIAVVAALGGSLSGVFGNVGTHIEQAGGGTPGGTTTGPLTGSEDECNPDGTYAGPTLWMKISGWDEWDTYPAGGAKKFKAYIASSGATVEVEGASARDDDGLPAYDFYADYNLGACGTAVDTGGNGGNDPNCNNGDYVGPTDNWYWKKFDHYEHGSMVTDRNGQHWEGATDYGTEFSWDDRGALEPDQLDNPDGTQNWLPNMAGNVYSLSIRYANGTLIIAQVTDTPPTDRVDVAAQVPTGNWDAQWYGNHPTYTLDQAGEQGDSVWAASPTDNGGVRHATAPDLGGLSVNYDSSCGGEGPN